MKAARLVNLSVIDITESKPSGRELGRDTTKSIVMVWWGNVGDWMLKDRGFRAGIAAMGRSMASARKQPSPSYSTIDPRRPFR